MRIYLHFFSKIICVCQKFSVPLQQILRNTHYILSIGLTLAIAALCLYPVYTPEMLKPVIGIDKLVHIAMYALLALAIYWESRRGWVALAVAIAYGGLIEILQAYCTNGMRSGDWLDWFADIIGASISVSVIMLIKKKTTSK